MARKALVLVEGTRANGPLYVKAARRLGLQPITLSADPTRYDYRAPEKLEAIRVNTDNLDALIRAQNFHKAKRLRSTLGRGNAASSKPKAAYINCTVRCPTVYVTPMEMRIVQTAHKCRDIRGRAT